MIDLVPELELVIGKQSPVEVLQPMESRNRLNAVLRDFLSVFAQENHPLVLFLDDMQWADPASLEFLKWLASHPDNRYLLVIGAYRDNEVSPSHPLMLALNEVAKGGIDIRSIKIKALTLKNLTDLIADSLRCSKQKARPLARIIRQKTDGNPFFTQQFLARLHQERLLVFDPEDRSWQWDPTTIQSVAITQNVVELMAAKIGTFPDQTGQILQIASCIGNTFDLESLTTVNGKSGQETAQSLWPAIREGLVLTLRQAEVHLTDPKLQEIGAEGFAEITFRFVHDQVQQAAYSLMSDQDRKQIHLQIGSILRDKPGDLAKSKHVFNIANHLNQAESLIQDPEKRLDLALLNYKAGLKAKASTAFAAALDFFRNGLVCLPDQCWRDHYQLTFNLYQARAETEYLNTHYEEAESLLATLLGHAQSTLEKAGVFKLMLAQYTIQGKNSEAIRRGLQGLALFGIHFPDSLAEIRGDYENERALLDKAMRGQKVEDLVNLPLIQDPNVLEPLHLCVGLAAPLVVAFSEREHALFNLLVLKLINFSMKHGDSTPTAMIYAYFAMGLRGMAKYADSYAFGKLGVEVANKYDSPSAKGLAGIIFWRLHQSLGRSRQDESPVSVPGPAGQYPNQQHRPSGLVDHALSGNLL